MISDIFPPAQPCLISLKLSFPLCPVNTSLSALCLPLFFFSYLVSAGALFCFFFHCVSGAALPICSVCPIERWKREERAFIALQGFVSNAGAYVFSKKSRTVWRGGDCMSSEKALFGYLFSFSFPHFHDHWYALGGCRNTWWLTGGAPYRGYGGCACHSFQRFFILFLSRSTFLQTAAWTVLELSIVRPDAWCTFGKAKQVEPLSPVPPPRLPSLFTAKALQQCCSSLKRWCP